ncbi:hypothetical protein ACFWWT_04225 [Streptomyces sp. NPDC058676]|uniref:hypothetical protein n=1 Tax=Streptomyces sp. NPDC058676 TaxID=3346593 RepID=UPI003649267B
MHRIVREKASKLPEWSDLPLSERDRATAEARLWLRAAIEAGIAPLAERPTPEHDAILLDSYGQIWGEYQTSPSSHGDAILRLVWESEVCSSKQELEERGVEFRLIGWSGE